MGFIGRFGDFSAIISPDFFFLSLLFLVLLSNFNPYIGSVDIVLQFTDVHFF